ncbi:MAG: PEGA domain-containing protein, partial [Acidobacteriota bacterium]
RRTVPPGTALRKQRTLSRVAEERPRHALDPIQLTDRVRGAPVEPPGTKKRNRTMMVVALVLLLLSGAIVALVGLTGPGLDDRGARADLGARLLTLRRDLGAPAVAPHDSAPARAERPAPAASTDLRAAPAATPDLGGKATLKVDSSPADAAVFLKGIKQCLTPCTIEELDPEVYLLSLKRKGYVNWSRLIDAATERRARVEAQLQEDPDPSRVGWLHVLSTPAAEVYVDGKFIGRVSSEGKIALPPGSYDISLRHPRKPRRPEFQVTIVRQQTVSIRERF